MNLSVGIVGLPNAGKSTLFNALASRRLSETAPRPFTTIEPHEAVVPLHDEDLHRLCDLVKADPSTSLRTGKPECVPATVTFIDIAGLVKDAHKGEGLGNQFLAKIKEVDAILHVVRGFEDTNVSHPHPSHDPGSINQIIEDIEIVNLELELGDIEKKPTIFVLNVTEKDVKNKEFSSKVKEKFGSEVVNICAKLEEEMIDLSDDEKREMFKMLEWERSALERLIQESYKLLDLITFYTIKGGKEVHAWSLKKGSSAIIAAETVHTDFAQKFIKAEIVNVGRLLDVGGWRQAKEKGLLKLEGKEYIVADKDVIEFKIGT